MAIEMIDGEEMIDFDLLKGTSQHLVFRWPKRFPIKAFTVQTDQALVEGLLRTFEKHPQLQGYSALVYGIRLGWCFTSLEAERANARSDALVKENNALRDRIEKLEQAVLGLQGIVGVPT